MDYKRLSGNETKEEIIKKISSFKIWKKTTNGLKVKNENWDNLLYCIKNIQYNKEADIANLARLGVFADPDEIVKNYAELMYNRKPFGNSKKALELRYGRKEGVRRFEIIQKKGIQAGKTSHFTLLYWINKGYSEEEAEAILKYNSTKAVNYRSKGSYDNHAQKIKFSIQYWVNKGYSEEEAEILRRPFLKPMIHDLNNMIDKHGEEEGIKKYMAMNEKRNKTIVDKYGSRSFIAGAFGRASKQSMEVFDPLIEWLETNNITMYYLGKGALYEYPIHTEDRVFFYDFTIPALKIIIEFNGVEWHYKNEESFSKNGILLGEKDKIIEYDTLKIETAKINEFDVLVIWNDVSSKENLELCKEFIQGKLDAYS